MSTITLVDPIDFAFEAEPPYATVSCILSPPEPEPEPEPEPTEAIFAPVPPNIEYESLPVIDTETQIIDTSPSRLIGCANELAEGDEQLILNALFPEAEEGDGVVNRANNDIWKYDGSQWDNVGPTPGVQVVTVSVLPPWNEICIYNARVRARIEVTALSYATELLTEVDPYVITLGLLAQSSKSAVIVPARNYNLLPRVPVISSGVSLDVPVVATNVGAIAPLISTGVAVGVPEIAIEVTSEIVPYIGPRVTAVQPPRVGIQVSLGEVEVFSGGSATIPSAGFNITSYPPEFNTVWGPNIITASITPSTSAAGPINNYYKRRVFVSTYSAAEMQNACGGSTSAMLYGVRLFVITAPTYQPYPGYAVGAKNTTNSTTTNNSGSNGGTFVTVRSAQPQSFVAGQYVELLFESPIQWTGNNFVFAWAWCATSDYSQTGTVQTGTGTSYHQQTDSAGCYLVTSSATGTVANRPALQLLYKA